MSESELIVDNIACLDSPRARARFIDARQKAKQFLKKKRGYKRPDFARMILDLRNLGWSHEKIAVVLDVSSSSTVSAWATGTCPFYEHGDMFIELWKDQTRLDRFPREGEREYQYDIGQLGLGIPGHQIYFATANKPIVENKPESLNELLDDFAEQIGLDLN
ncbi:hypothetical protein [Acinetobacter pollinis]|uniref:hypothetical protein n=1 Tax=Acinetobacter pollinis TaxID=2605270 RepID=UPI002DBA0837|nr:hypothetical protein [Acinetobacter pollinis]